MDIGTDTIDRWLTSTGQLFFAIKNQFELPDEWRFSIAKPDVVAQTVEEEALNDLTGAAAFTLRKVQALRHLLKGQPWEDRAQLNMLASYTSELYVFCTNLEDRELLNSENLRIVQRSRMDMKALAAELALALHAL